jgi:hypothetical protein
MIIKLLLVCSLFYGLIVHGYGEWNQEVDNGKGFRSLEEVDRYLKTSVINNYFKKITFYTSESVCATFTDLFINLNPPVKSKTVVLKLGTSFVLPSTFGHYESRILKLIEINEHQVVFEYTHHFAFSPTSKRKIILDLN